MGAPVPERQQTNSGRRGQVTFHVRWTQSDSSQLSNSKIISLDDLPSAYTAGMSQKRYAVEFVEWVSSTLVSGDIEFDSMPMDPSGLVLSFPMDATMGEHNFSSHPSGCLPDPNRLSPGNVVVTTRNALPGDELFIRMGYKVKGVKSVF